MPLSLLGTFGATANFVPSTSVQSFTNPGPNTAYTVYTNRDIVMAINPVGGSNVVTQNDLILTADEAYARVVLDVGAEIQFMLVTGQSTGGITKFTASGNNW